MARLLLVRHGETSQNSSLRYWGRSDVPLGDDGERQAERLRERLKGERLDFAYSSPLKRAAVTAVHILSDRHMDLTLHSDLREIDFGEMEGLTFDEVNQRYPDVARMWMERSAALAYPGGESIANLEKRVSNFKGYLGKHITDETVLIVAHSGVLRTLVCQLLNLGLECHWQFRLDLASLTIIETYPQYAILTLLNDCSHLAEVR